MQLRPSICSNDSTEVGRSSVQSLSPQHEVAPRRSIDSALNGNDSHRSSVPLGGHSRSEFLQTGNALNEKLERFARGVFRNELRQMSSSMESTLCDALRQCLSEDTGFDHQSASMVSWQSDAGKPDDTGKMVSFQNYVPDSPMMRRENVLQYHHQPMAMTSALSMNWSSRHRRLFDDGVGQMDSASSMKVGKTPTTTPPASMARLSSIRSSFSVLQKASSIKEEEVEHVSTSYTPLGESALVASPSEGTNPRRSSTVSLVSRYDSERDSFSLNTRRSASSAANRRPSTHSGISTMQGKGISRRIDEDDMNDGAIGLQSSLKSEMAEGYDGHEYHWAVLKIIEGAMWTYTISAMICLNAIVIGIQTDYMARTWSETPPFYFHWLELGFCVVFVTEILIRICVHGLSFFTSFPSWNWFDLAAVTVQLYDDVVVVYIWRSDQFSAKGFSVLRILRLLRLLRLARLLHNLTELRMLIVSIMEAAKSAIWAFFLLLMIMYVVGVYFTQIVTTHKVQKGTTPDTELLDRMYGSLSSSMLTLFESIASGVSWKEVAEPLSFNGPILVLVFVLYIAFTLFVVLNIVTGVFVGSATEQAKEDTKTVLMFHLRELFRRADTEQSGRMSAEMFVSHLSDPSMQAYLRAVDIHCEEAAELFALLDVYDSDELDEVEFVSGCMSLHGLAKAIDLATLSRELTHFIKDYSSHKDFMEFAFAQIEEYVNCSGFQRRISPGTPQRQRSD